MNCYLACFVSGCSALEGIKGADVYIHIRGRRIASLKQALLLQAIGFLFPTLGTADATPIPKRITPSPRQLEGFICRLKILPLTLVLDGSRAEQRVVVLATQRDGSVRDVTDTARLALEKPGPVTLNAGVLHPRADGETRLTARLGRLAAPPILVRVVHATQPAESSFVNDIAPIFSRAGCNGTTCHGSPAGKGGLKLSLFGYEPDQDFAALAREAEGRRIDRKNPAESLLLRKATGAVSHGGGRRLAKEGREYRTLLAWLKEGAPGPGEIEARVERIEVTPDAPWLPAPGERLRLVVTAQMSDGSRRDVTGQALFSSNDDSVSAVDDQGRVTARQSGETAVMVRHLGQVAVARVAVLPKWRLTSPQLATTAPTGNYMDDQVRAKLRRLQLVPSAPCTDEEFLRRATLDTCGIIPTPEEVRAFRSDTDPQKRVKLVDRLLERPEFVDLWTLKWNDLLRNNPRVTRRGMLDYYRWIRAQIATNRPYDQFVRDLLTATGRNTSETVTLESLPPQLRERPAIPRLLARANAVPFNAAANYFTVSPNALDAASATTQVFLGVRLECARCHNHPFERWTQSDYYGLAAFFDGVRAQGRNQLPTVVQFNPRAPDLRHPKTNEPVQPRTLDGVAAAPVLGGDARGAMVTWMTSPENPYFARALVNRLWAHYIGRGIVEPVDDLRVTNPPANPELLNALARDFATHGFDVKRMHRVILTSRTYAQSSRPNQWNRDDRVNFARYYPKRLMAEQVYDSISQATGVFLDTLRPRRGLLGGGGRYGALLPDEPIQRAAQIPALPPAGRNRAGSPAQFLDTFGKPRREVICECERSSEGHMGQALALMNGEEVNRKIASPLGRVRELLRTNRPAPELIEELYLSTLSRGPTPLELKEAMALLAAGKTPAEGAEDLMWSLLNSREFLFNH